MWYYSREMSFDTIKPPCSSVENRPGCMQAALEIIGDKWTPLLLGQLVSGQKTFGELEQMLTGISPRTLSARLNKLEEESIYEKEQIQRSSSPFQIRFDRKRQRLARSFNSNGRMGRKVPL
jgi:DNA-binding HxlR family transcriptional regulator